MTCPGTCCLSAGVGVSRCESTYFYVSWDRSIFLLVPGQVTVSIFLCVPKPPYFREYPKTHQPKKIFCPPAKNILTSFSHHKFCLYQTFISQKVFFQIPTKMTLRYEPVMKFYEIYKEHSPATKSPSKKTHVIPSFSKEKKSAPPTTSRKSYCYI